MVAKALGIRLVSSSVSIRSEFQIRLRSVTWRKHSLAYVDGGKVRMDYRAVHLTPLTTEAEGGINLKKIAPKARVY